MNRGSEEEGSDFFLVHFFLFDFWLGLLIDTLSSSEHRRSIPLLLLVQVIPSHHFWHTYNAAPYLVLATRSQLLDSFAVGHFLSALVTALCSLFRPDTLLALVLGFGEVGRHCIICIMSALST